MSHILLTNDDGIDAPGLAALRRGLESLGTVLTLAPDGNRSAIARGITIDRPLHARETGFGDGFLGFSLDGTPADCVRAAALGFFGERPEIVVAGVNAGANLGDDVAYSGTVAAALEGALLGLPSVAISIQGRAPRHFDDAATLAAPIVARVLADGLPQGLVLNVNVPDLAADAVRGVQVTRLGCAGVHERIVLEAGDGTVTRYTIAGEERDCRHETGTDFAALAAGYISITPLQFDLVDPRAFELLEGWKLNEAVAAVLPAGAMRQSGADGPPESGAPESGADGPRVSGSPGAPGQARRDAGEHKEASA
jgi:5'-nucleotidase